MWLWPSGLRR